MKRVQWISAGILFCFPFTLSAQFAFYDSLNGIYWAQIEPPSGEYFGYSQIVREGLGYLTGSTGALYEYDASRSQQWRRLPRPEPYKMDKYFALASDDIWALIEVSEVYKRVLFHWNGQGWSPSFTRNVYNIRDLIFFSPHEGWIGGDYGELWHYFRGQWQQEALPVFIHVNRLALAPDSSLYAACKAPEQGALLQRQNGEWRILSSDFIKENVIMVFTPANRLLLCHPDFSPQHLRFGDRETWFVPMASVAFFPDGAGYGVSGRTIYAFQDTAYMPIAQAPVPLSEVRLFNQRFSWILGAEGMILMPHLPSSFPPPKVERPFGILECPITRLYGMGVLQDQPGKPSWLYLVATEAPNVVYDRHAFFPKKIPKENRFPDLAPNLNLTGVQRYSDRLDSFGETYTNYDQSVVTGDLNGDGYDDIIVIGMYGRPFVYFHSGHEYYFEATRYCGLNEWGDIRQRPMLANLFDADHDGDLDLFIACQYRSNAFFVNDGRGRFIEVGQAAGLSTDGGGIGGYVADFDGDGWEDLYVTRVSRANLMYRNLGPDASTGLPRFADVSVGSGEACWPGLKQSQGAAIADYDNDGDFDLFVCNLGESNRLLQNDGKGHFIDMTVAAGLASGDFSSGATFFDADHDGELDLLVANRGPDRFYKNNGDGTFTEHSEYLGSQLGGVNLMDSSKRLGGYSTGTLAIDVDDDADLDPLIGNYDTGLFVFRNNLDRPRTTILIFPEGIVSNRSAVGAKVFLYDAGKIDDPQGLVGLRMIESANSYGCSPEKLAHFGVDPEKTYDAKIVFPSGIVREIRGMRGGERRIVLELEALAALFIKVRRTLANLLTGYRSREGYSVLLASTMLLILMLLAGRKFFNLSAHDQKIFVGVYSAMFLVCFVLWFARDQFTFITRPLGLSVVLSVLVIIILHAKRLYQARPASLEMLQVRLNAFGHGTLIHDLMNRFAFYAENADAAAAMPAAGREKLLETLQGLLHFLNNEVTAILRYQYGNNFATDLALRLETTWDKLKKALQRLRRILQSDEKLAETSFTEIVKLQQQLRTLVKEIKMQLSEQYYTEVHAVITELLRQGDYPGVQFLPSPKPPRVRVTDADLSYVLDELVQNALRHVDGQTAQIEIIIHHVYDEVRIDIRDNGSGIPKNLWEEIFRFGFTTKPEGKGGFGLYHARQRLEKYGGKIFVAASEIGKGTIMRICLQAEIRLENEA